MTRLVKPGIVRRGVLTACVIIILMAGLGTAYYSWVIQDITIIYTNDIHGRTGPSRGMAAPPGVEAVRLGGFASLATYLKSEDVSDDRILLDAGDFYQGTLEGESRGGEGVVRLMNALGYDAVTVGNHDFHHGARNLERLGGAADFPLLGANVVSADTGEVAGGLTARAVLERDGTRVGIVGITLPLNGMEGVEFAPIVEAAEEQVKSLQEEGVKFIILLTHLGLSASSPETSPDYRLAKEVEGVDVIVGGHYHAIIDPPCVVPESGTLICQAGSHLTQVGRLDLKYNRLTGRVAGYSNKIVPLRLARYHEDEQVALLVTLNESEIGDEANEVLGYAIDDIPGSWTVFPMGNLVTDLMREAAGTDVAFINKSGIRDGIPRGEIAYRDIYKVLPFSNELVTFDLSGARVKKLLEGDAAWRGERLYFSGLAATYDMRMAPGHRLVEADIGGAPVEDGVTYSVCTIDFLGEALPDLEGLRSVGRTGVMVRDLLEEYVRDNYYVEAPPGGERVRELRQP